MTYRFADEAHSVIAAPEGGFIPVDSENTDYARLVAEAVPIEDYVAPPAPVPVEVARHQALLALRSAGVTRAVIEAAIAAIADDDERDVLEIRYGQPAWRRDSEFIAWGKAAFGLTDAQVDDLFRLAVTL